jgi:hypothetical protein
MSQNHPRRACKSKFGHVRILARNNIKPSPENDQLYQPIDPTDPAILELRDSIKTLGFKGSLIISKDGYILSGHRRHFAAGLAGLTKLPCTTENINRVLKGGRINPAFVKRLEMFNRQRVKSLDEQLRESVVKADPNDAHRVLSQYREARALLDDCSLIQLRAFKKRAEISPAKFPMISAIKGIFADLKAFLPLTDRVIHYKLLNDPPLRHASKPHSTYQNDDHSWKDLCDLLTRMRLENIIPFEWLEDATRPVVILTSYHNAGVFMTEQTDGLLKNYYRNLQQSQPVHLEIVYEKSTGRSFVEPSALNFCIPLTVGRGFCSLPPRVAMAKRFQASGKDRLVVIAMSDLDPDGDEITHSFARSMRDDFGIDVQCIKAALTMDQVKRLNLPPNKMKAKAKSSNYPKYKAKYGTEDVYELEALDPAQQRQLLEDAILSVLDDEAYNYEVDREKEEAAFLDEKRRCALLAIGVSIN